ncbi:solute carrier family 35 member B1-like [Tigriopus californicus]|uniref:solute carrier family 35 member B1-like n=1 Tax=Tigriopus californicus TaxID=6832 RepID=UPI0027DA375F|nr:solute carrier family 35 member B1-like [Tigriopus californicus]
MGAKSKSVSPSGPEGGHAHSSSVLRFFFCASGIFVCFFFFGILQERINRGEYGEGPATERFTYTLALVFFQCVVNYLYAVIMSKVVLKQGQDRTKSSYYAICAFTYLTAMVSSNKALTWVNYPTQIVLGVAMFMFKDVKVDDKSDGSLLGLGEIMLLLSLTCDGLTGAVQERMKLDYQTKSGHMMTSMNKWSVFYLGIALTATGELWEFFGFVQRHPSVLYELGLFSIASALGQYFIFMCVSEFGPLPCSICTTTRKFFTVMGSVVIFGNSLMPRQWMGATLVFTGLFLDGLYGREAPKKAVK